jgi:hypothetical protein
VRKILIITRKKFAEKHFLTELALKYNNNKNYVQGGDYESKKTISCLCCLFYVLVFMGPNK